MKFTLRHALPFFLAAVPAFAVYAPIPEEEQGKALTFRLAGSVYHDSNIFGSATGEIDSLVYNFSPAILFNSSVSDQTFVSAGYELSIDRFSDRPGDKTLVNHVLSARVAHSFSRETVLDVSDRYEAIDNPPSLLNGVAVNGDQSFKRNEFNARFSTAIAQKTGATVKYRNVDLNYDNASLSDLLDRRENLIGLELNYSLLPKTKLVGEYRYQDIAYAAGGASKDKESHFFLAGVDHQLSEQTVATGRVGAEDRTREGAPDTTSPYVELSLRHQYAEGSYLSGGYTYTLEEPSDTARFTDAEMNRFFANVQHRLTGTVIASGSLTYESAQLQGRPAISPDIDESTVRFGVGLSWMPNRSWTFSATADRDSVDSDDPQREQERDRVGVTARYVF